MCVCVCVCVCVKRDLDLRGSTLIYTNPIVKRRTVLESYLHDYQLVFNGGKRNYLVSNFFLIVTLPLNFLLIHCFSML